jgi:hypothetical protein
MRAGRFSGRMCLELFERPMTPQLRCPESQIPPLPALNSRLWTTTSDYLRVISSQ